MPPAPVPNAAPDVCLRSWGVPFDISRCSRMARRGLLHRRWIHSVLLPSRPCFKLNVDGCHLGRALCELTDLSPHAGHRTSPLAQHRPAFNTASRNGHMVSCQLTHSLYYCCWVISRVLGLNLVWGCVTVTLKWPQLMIQEKWRRVCSCEKTKWMNKNDYNTVARAFLLDC